VRAADDEVYVYANGRPGIHPYYSTRRFGAERDVLFRGYFACISVRYLPMLTSSAVWSARRLLTHHRASTRGKTLERCPAEPRLFTTGDAVEGHEPRRAHRASARGKTPEARSRGQRTRIERPGRVGRCRGSRARGAPRANRARVRGASHPRALPGAAERRSTSARRGVPARERSEEDGEERKRDST